MNFLTFSDKQINNFLYGLVTSILVLMGIVQYFFVGISTTYANVNCANSDIPQVECEALVALYNSTGGDNWTDNSGWMNDDDFCDAFGITCAGGNIHQVDLIGNNLVGNLPIEIGNLTNAIYLRLGNNSLSGNIPTQISTMSSLISLVLEGNDFTGTIPSELGNLANLVVLRLSNNDLSGAIPTELGNLSNLLILYIELNNLSGLIPTELGNLTNLIDLRLTGNSLTGVIPTQLGNLVNLTTLMLHQNQLTGSIPSSFGNLINLTILILSGNSLTGSIPSDLSGLVNLETLVLGANQLTGPIPTRLGNLNALEQLLLIGNDFTGTIPVELGNLINLRNLSLSGNLSGPIPTEFGNLIALEDLQIRDTPITGTIPSELGDLPNLDTIGLINTQLTGPIPSGFANMGLLNVNTQFRFDSNLYEGTVPSFLDGIDQIIINGTNTICGEEPTFTVVDVPPVDQALCDAGMYCNTDADCVSNSCVGNICETGSGGGGGGNGGGSNGVVDCANSDIPQVECEALVALYNSTGGDNWTDNSGWMNDDDFCDAFGITCAGGSVTSINLNNNNLAGQLPNQIGDFSALLELDLGRSYYLVGPLPSTIGNLNNIEVISFSQSSISGSIPVVLSTLSNLQTLNLFSNELTGTIPPELGNLSNLQTLHLAQNDLSGNIPTELGNLSSLTYLALSLNQITGTIIPQIGNLSNLEYFAINGNQLTGVIPVELGNLPNLWQVNLGDNELSGSIPTNFFNPSNLTYVYLHNNNLTGIIPSEIGNGTNIIELALNGNQFMGVVPATIGDLINLERLWLGSNNLSLPTSTVIGNLSSLGYFDYSSNNYSGAVPSYLNGISEIIINGTNTICGEEPVFTVEDVPPVDLALCDAGMYCNTDADCASNSCVGNICEAGSGGGGGGTSGGGNGVVDCTNSDIPQVECEALVALYNSTGGDNWTDNTGWMNDNDLCDANGVTCDLGVVTSLFITQNNLVGILPLELGNLINLSQLNFSFNNNLTGPIPSEIGDLSNLTQLSLFNNNLTGSIPPQLGALSSLQILRLHGNGLTGTIPSELGNLSNISDFNLAGNFLTGTIPPELGDLSNATELKFGGNDLQGPIPSELGNLTLSKFLFQNNQYEGAVPSFLDGIGSIFINGTNTICGVNPTFTVLDVPPVDQALCDAGMYCNSNVDCASNSCVGNICEAGSGGGGGGTSGGGNGVVDISIVKTVINDDQGTLQPTDFSFDIDDAHTNGTILGTITSGGSAALDNAGMYHLFEDSEAGYDFINTVCTRDSDSVIVYQGNTDSPENYVDATNNRIHVGHFMTELGQTYSCVVTNDDTEQLNVETCEAGYHWDGADSCIPCATGSYCGGGSDVAIFCPQGKTSYAGSSDSNDCFNIPICGNGFCETIGGETANTCQQDCSNNDTDGDSIDDVLEVGGPNNGDANFDGIGDDAQTDVATLPTANARVVSSIDISDSSNCDSFSQVVNVPANTVINDDNYTFPFGLHTMDFACESVDVTIYYHGLSDLSNYTYRKYSDDLGWYTLPITKGIQNGVGYVSFTLTDGGEGDADGLDNGVILDPGGLGQVVVHSSSSNRFGGSASSIECGLDCPGLPVSYNFKNRKNASDYLIEEEKIRNIIPKQSLPVVEIAGNVETYLEESILPSVHGSASNYGSNSIMILKYILTKISGQEDKKQQQYITAIITKLDKYDDTILNKLGINKTVVLDTLYASISAQNVSSYTIEMNDEMVLFTWLGAKQIKRATWHWGAGLTSGCERDQCNRFNQSKNNISGSEVMVWMTYTNEERERITLTIK